MKTKYFCPILFFALLAACNNPSTVLSEKASNSSILKNRMCDLTLENFGDTLEEQLSMHGDCDISSLWNLEEDMTSEDGQKLSDLIAFEIGALGYNPDLFSSETLMNNIRGCLLYTSPSPRD